MSDEPVRVLPLEYAQDESLSWRVAARAVAMLMIIYTSARLVTSAVQVVSCIFLPGVGLAGFWPYAIESLASVPPLIAVLVAASYALSGRGRVGLIWTLIIYIVLRAGMVLLVVILGAMALRSTPTSPSSGYVMASYVTRLFSTAADCIWPAAAIWFYTRPALRRVS